MEKRRYSPIWTFLALAILAMFIIFVVYPLALVLYKSVVNPADNSFTLENFTRFFTRKYYTNTLLNSFRVTVVSTLISAALGLVIAYITRQYRIAGSTLIEVINEALGLSLPTDQGYESLGGLIYSRMMTIPKDGSHPVVECYGLRIRAEEIIDRRVEWATVTVLEPVAEKAAPGPESKEEA